MIICRKCGTENDSTAGSCTVCGAVLELKRSVDTVQTDSDGKELKFTPRSSKRAKPALKLSEIGRKAAGFFGKHWKWFLPAVAVLLVAVIIISSIASVKPDYGLLAISPEYVSFSLAGETAEGAFPLVGLMDSKGKVVLAAEYQSVLSEVDGDVFAVIGTNAKIGAVNRKGKTVIKCNYLSADTEMGFSHGLWAVENADGWGFVNKKGKTKIAHRFEAARGFSDGLAAVFNGSKWGYINEKGKLVIDYAFDDASYFDSGLARVCINGKYGFINKKGEEVVKCEFESAYPYFENGLCLVKSGSRYGYINDKGEYEINPQFDDALPFSEGLAAFKIDGKIGYINKKGKYVIKPQYSGELTKESMFYEGCAVVYDGSTAIVINKRGKSVVKKEIGASEITHLHDGFFIARVDGKYGILSAKSGDFTLEPTYDGLLLSMREVAVFEDGSEGVSLFVAGDGETVATVGSQLIHGRFMSTVTPKTVAVMKWCESGNR